MQKSISQLKEMARSSKEGLVSAPSTKKYIERREVIRRLSFIDSLSEVKAAAATVPADKRKKFLATFLKECRYAFSAYDYKGVREAGDGYDKLFDKFFSEAEKESLYATTESFQEAVDKLTALLDLAYQEYRDKNYEL